MDKIIFFTILVVFPFGQLFKIGMFNLFDILVATLAIIVLIKKPVFPNWYKYFLMFILFAFFSWVVNYLSFDNNPEIFKGLLYLLRLISYSFVAVFVYNQYKNKEANFLLDKLQYVSVAAAIFGFIQYFLYPDLTSLKYLGWDDHLLRMVGTFLDPTFLSLILVFGAIISIYRKKDYLLYFLSIAVAFTYSRISFLLIFLLLIFKKKYIGLVVFIVTLLLLPKMIGEGTNLARTASGYNKLNNYVETYQIIKKSPVFGIGYNNFCFARQLYLNDTSIKSHSCNGSDSSILFILATTGVLGLIIFIYFVLNLPKSEILITTFVAVLLHSIFANSLFYPHIMFWLFALIGLKREVNGKIT